MILSIMIDKNILLEVNTSSLNDSCDEPMPSYSVINRYVQLGGNKIVIGSDAHSSDRLSGHFRDVVPRLPNRIQIGYFRDEAVIIGLKPPSINGRRFSPIFIYWAFPDITRGYATSEEKEENRT